MVLGTGGERTPQDEVINSFVEAVATGDGRLIALPGVKSRLGEGLFLSTRWGEDDVDKGTFYLNVDVFADRSGKYIPVGIYDWEIKGNKAVGNKQRHGHLPAMNSAQEAAERYWATGEAFHVRDEDLLRYAMEVGGYETMSKLREMGVVRDGDDWAEKVYQGRGIGSLMIAVSALVLDSQGIEEMDLGTLSEPAQKAWEKFGRGNRTRLSPAEIANLAVVMEVISKFVV